MAQELEHIELANRNHDTLVFLAPHVDEHPEWVATIAFYKAVQVVEAVVWNHLKSHCHGHDARLGCLKTPVFSDLFKQYRHLYAASLVARYLVDSSGQKIDGPSGAPRKHYAKFADYMPPEKVTKRLLKRLDALEAEATKFLSEEGRKRWKRIHHYLNPREPQSESMDLAGG